MRQRIDACLVLWQDLQIFVVLCLSWPNAALRGLQLHLKATIFHLFLSLFINQRIVSLIHNLRNRILFGINILNLELGVSHNHQILNHGAKVILAHHQILLSCFFADIKQKVSVAMHILLGDLACLTIEQLCRDENLLLTVVHPEYCESETCENWFAAELQAEDWNLVDAGVEDALAVEVFLLLLACQLSLAS